MRTRKKMIRTSEGKRLKILEVAWSHFAKASSQHFQASHELKSAREAQHRTSAKAAREGDTEREEVKEDRRNSRACFHFVVHMYYTYQPIFFLKRKFPEKSRLIPLARRVSPSPGAVVNDEEIIEALLFLMLKAKF